jgi:hypothetical protein
VPLLKEYEGFQPDAVEELPIYHPYGTAKPYQLIMLFFVVESTAGFRKR